MAKIYIVAYDLKGQADKYGSLFSELKRFPKWWHYIDSAWLIKSDVDAAAIVERLRPHFDDSVNLFVIDVGKDNNGWLPDKAWNWIRQNVDAPR